jgi:hypothetical protein
MSAEYGTLDREREQINSSQQEAAGCRDASILRTVHLYTVPPYVGIVLGGCHLGWPWLQTIQESPSVLRTRRTRRRHDTSGTPTTPHLSTVQSRRFPRPVQRPERRRQAHRVIQATAADGLCASSRYDCVQCCASQHPGHDSCEAD